MASFTTENSPLGISNSNPDGRLFYQQIEPLVALSGYTFKVNQQKWNDKIGQRNDPTNEDVCPQNGRLPKVAVAVWHKISIK